MTRRQMAFVIKLQLEGLVATPVEDGHVWCAHSPSGRNFHSFSSEVIEATLLDELVTIALDGRVSKALLDNALAELDCDDELSDLVLSS